MIRGVAAVIVFDGPFRMERESTGATSSTTTIDRITGMAFVAKTTGKRAFMAILGVTKRSSAVSGLILNEHGIREPDSER